MTPLPQPRIAFDRVEITIAYGIAVLLAVVSSLKWRVVVAFAAEKWLITRKNYEPVDVPNTQIGLKNVRRNAKTLSDQALFTRMTSYIHI